MKNKVARLSLVVTLSIFMWSCQDGGIGIQEVFNVQTSDSTARTVTDTSGVLFKVVSDVESITDNLYSVPVKPFSQIGLSDIPDTQSCDTGDTAQVVIYSTNGEAHSEIDVTLDGQAIGSLTTYFPDDNPHCKTPSAQGVINLSVPAGKHTIEAASSNMSWPSHVFSIEKCGCILLPLS